MVKMRKCKSRWRQDKHGENDQMLAGVLSGMFTKAMQEAGAQI